MSKTTLAFLGLIITCFTLPVSAALPLKAIGVHKSLGEDVFYAGVFINADLNEANIHNKALAKRLELRIVKPKITYKSFNHSLAQAISINNERSVLKKFEAQIIGFTKAIRWNLKAGDHLAVELNKAKINVLFNGHTIYTSKKPEFFSVIASAWFGHRPLSDSFKRELLAQNIEQHLSVFNAIQPIVNRLNIAAPKRPKALVKTKENSASERTITAKVKTVKRPTNANVAKAQTKKVASKKARNNAKAALRKTIARFALNVTACKSTEGNNIDSLQSMLNNTRGQIEQLRTNTKTQKYLKSYPKWSESRDLIALMNEAEACARNLASISDEIIKREKSNRSIAGKVNFVAKGAANGIIYIDGLIEAGPAEVQVAFIRQRFKSKYIFVKPGDTLKIRNRDRLSHHFVALDEDKNTVIDFGLQSPSKIIERKVDWPTNTIVKLVSKKVIGSFTYIVNIPSTKYQMLSASDEQNKFQFRFTNLPASANEAKLLIPGAKLVNVPFGTRVKNNSPVMMNSRKIADLNVNTVWH